MQKISAAHPCGASEGQVTNMFTFHVDPSFTQAGVPFGVTEAVFPDKSQWDLAAFDALKEQELAALRQEMAGYDRKAIFGDNPYNRYFKKYKKTYPVLQQLESWLLKGRPFPSGNPINEVTFLTELRTQVLLGTHDIDRIRGQAELFRPTEKLPFPGMRGEEIHCYPGDVTARDQEGIILSLIAGPDERTHIRLDSTHIAFLFFAVPGVTETELSAVQDRLAGYARVLAPGAELSSAIL